MQRICGITDSTTEVLKFTHGETASACDDALVSRLSPRTDELNARTTSPGVGRLLQSGPSHGKSLALANLVTPANLKICRSNDRWGCVACLHSEAAGPPFAYMRAARRVCGRWSTFLYKRDAVRRESETLSSVAAATKRGRRIRWNGGILKKATCGIDQGCEGGPAIPRVTEAQLRLRPFHPRRNR